MPKLINVALVAAPGPMTPTAGSAPPPPPPPPPEEISPDKTPPPEPEKPKPPEPEKPKPPEPEKPKPPEPEKPKSDKGKPTADSEKTWKLSYVAKPESAGTIAGPPTIPTKKGSAVEVAVTENAGFMVESITASNGAKVGGDGPYVLSDVTADTTVTAKLVKGTKKTKKEEEKLAKELAKKEEDKKKEENKKKEEDKKKTVVLDKGADPKDEVPQKTPTKGGKPVPKIKGPTLAGAEPSDNMMPSDVPISMAVGTGGQGPPTAMGSWPGLLQRQVYLQWVVPNGIPMNDANYLPQITVTIGRDGRIIDRPQVTKASPSTALDDSCVQALVNATIPPFPDNFEEPTITLVVQFSPMGRQSMGGGMPQPSTPGF